MRSPDTKLSGLLFILGYSFYNDIIYFIIIANVCQDNNFIMATQIGDNLKELRTKQNLLLRQVVSKLEVDTSIISKMERGQRPIEEYPNINWVRGQPDLNSIFGMFSIIFEGKTYYDFENSRIRTEWRINCNYSGPDEFCSLKSENEYDYH